MSYSPPPHYRSQPAVDEQAPKREEWAIINNYKAIQYERLKQLEKAADIEKKRKFKQQLDNQLHNKSDAALIQKQQDKRYYEYITKKTEEQKRQEDLLKMEKIIKRKHVEEQNQYHLEHMRNSRNRNQSSGYNFDIGVKAEMERRRREEQHKRQMLDTLDKQLKIKEEERRLQKMNDLEQDENNLKYQYEQFDRRNNRNRSYGQNPKVYEYYRDLELERMRREKELEHRLVQQAAAKKMQEQDYKRYLKQEQKKHLNHEMKHTLDQQVQMHTVMAREKGRFNPEDNSYQVIGNIFKQKQSPYDKRAYSEYLKRQAEEQAKRKRKQKYMSDEQYRINMNQLNRAVNGSYAHDQYIDRSLGSIGEANKKNLTQIHDKVQDEDVDVVKNRLDHLKQRMIPTRTHNGHNGSGIF